MAMARSQLTAQARRRHTFLLPILSTRYSLVFSHSNLFSFSSSSLSPDRLRLRALYKQLQVWKGLRISSSFTHLQNVHSCIRNHSVPQITVSLVRQAAHNMHTACITSCTHVTKNSNNALTTAGFTPCLAHAIIIFSGP